MLHFHLVEILVIVVVTSLCLFANNVYSPPPLKRYLYGFIVIAAVLALLVSVGALGGSWFSVSR